MKFYRGPTPDMMVIRDAREDAVFSAIQRSQYLVDTAEIARVNFVLFVISEAVSLGVSEYIAAPLIGRLLVRIATPETIEAATAAAEASEATVAGSGSSETNVAASITKRRFLSAAEMQI